MELRNRTLTALLITFLITRPVESAGGKKLEPPPFLAPLIRSGMPLETPQQARDRLASKTNRPRVSESSKPHGPVLKPSGGVTGSGTRPIKKRRAEMQKLSKRKAPTVIQSQGGAPTVKVGEHRVLGPSKIRPAESLEPSTLSTKTESFPTSSSPMPVMVPSPVSKPSGGATGPGRVGGLKKIFKEPIGTTRGVKIPSATGLSKSRVSGSSKPPRTYHQGEAASGNASETSTYTPQTIQWWYRVQESW